MKNPFILPLILICISMMLLVIPKKKHYVTVREKITVKTHKVRYADHNVPNNEKQLFNRETMEFLDMDSNVLGVADTFYVDGNNKITEIVVSESEIINQ